jgi:multidrug efflux pump subunit AcrA (membrane-fusion protein)
VVREKPTFTVATGDVVRTLELTGRASPIKQQELFFRVDGFVKEIFVKRGDTVQENDLLARLDEPEKYDADIAAAQLALEQTRFDFEKLKLDAPVKAADAQIALLKAEEEYLKAKKDRSRIGGVRVTDPLVIEKAKSEIKVAEDAYKEAQEQYANYSDHPETDPLRIDAVATLLATRTNYNYALINLTYLTGKATPTDLAMADADLALKEAKYNQAKGELERWQAGGEALEMRLAEARVSDAEAKLVLAQKAKENVEMRAPFSGQITSMGLVPGSQVTAFRAVMVLANPDDLEITAIPTADDLANLGVEQSAIIRLLAQPGKEFPGRITSMPVPSSSSGGQGSGQSTASSALHIAIEDSTAQLTLGETATVIILIDQRQGVLWLPPAALRTFQGLDFVLVEESGVQRRVNVTLGLKSKDRIEIVQGLTEGQVVVGP